MRSERGAILIQVAVAMVGLLGFAAFVTDYGVLWVSRRQAQNAADAAALAGAISMLHNPGDFNVARASAKAVGETNKIFGLAPTINLGNGDSVDETEDISFPLCPPGVGEGLKACIRVNVYRNESRDPLPTFFAALFGMSVQGVKATATAQVGSGNQVNCLLPFAIMDRWADNYDKTPDTQYFANDALPGIPGWSPNDGFEFAKGDVYVPPYTGNTGMTGWTIANDYGRQFILKDGTNNPYSSGWFNEVDLPDSTGSKDYEWNIKNCNESPVGIADAGESCSSVDDTKGCVSVKTGGSQGPSVKHGVDVLVSKDSGAMWDAGAPGPDGHTGAVVGGLGMSSPRIRPMVVVDIGNYMDQNCNGSTCIAKVANILGFFVEGVCSDVTMDPGMICDDPNKDVVGRIVMVPGTDVAGGGTVESPASFVETIRLVR